MLFKIVRKNPDYRRPVCLPVLALMLALSSGCTTHSYYRDDGAKITVKKFVGIPYIKKEERTSTRMPGSEYKPVE